MPPIKGRTLAQRSRKSCPTSRPKSSSAPIRSKDLSCCPSAGSSSARLLGSTVVEGLPRIGKTSIARGSHSCASPQSASCSENSAIPPDVLGQTLKEIAITRRNLVTYVANELGGVHYDPNRLPANTEDATQFKVLRTQYDWEN